MSGDGLSGSGQDQANRLVDDILRKTKEREERAPLVAPQPPSGKWRARLLAAAAPIVIIMTLGNLLAFFPQTAQPAPEDRDDLRFELFLVAQEIHLYQKEHGSLPTDLAVLGLDDPELQYVVTDRSFALTMDDNGMTVSYQPGDPDEERYAAAFDMLAEGGVG